VRHPQQGGQRGVPAGLLDHPLAGVDEHEREVGGRGSGDHVARVLHVPGVSATMKLRTGVEK
jgi:hypothetical protein